MTNVTLGMQTEDAQAATPDINYQEPHALHHLVLVVVVLLVEYGNQALNQTVIKTQFQ
jgi:hypothetical protein